MPTACEGKAFMRAKASAGVARRTMQTMLRFTTTVCALLTSASVNNSVTNFL